MGRCGNGWIKWTYDFSKMYTTLKLESPPGDESKDSRGMKEMMKKYAALVFDWAKQNHGTWGKERYYW